MDSVKILEKHRELANTITKATTQSEKIGEINSLIFAYIPACMEVEDGVKDGHQVAIDTYTKALKKAIMSLDDTITDISVTYSTNPQPLRGSLFGDRFTLGIKVDHFEKDFIFDLCLTNSDETEVNKIRKMVETEEATQLLNVLTSKYLDLDFTFSADVKAERFSKTAFFDDLIEKIDKVYEMSEYNPCMDTVDFYSTQIDLLIKKMKTLQLDKETKQETLRNNAILLKYFLCKYVMKFYSDKYKHIV